MWVLVEELDWNVPASKGPRVHLYHLNKQQNISENAGFASLILMEDISPICHVGHPWKLTFQKMMWGISYTIHFNGKALHLQHYLFSLCHWAHWVVLIEIDTSGKEVYRCTKSTLPYVQIFDFRFLHFMTYNDIKFRFKQTLCPYLFVKAVFGSLMSILFWQLRTKLPYVLNHKLVILVFNCILEVAKVLCLELLP